MFSDEEQLPLSIPKKDFSHYIKIPSSKDLPITSIKKSIFFYGFPNDEGKYNIGGRVGSEKGPFSFRKGLQDHDFNTFKNIDSISIRDEGNAPNHILLENSLWETHKASQMKIQELLSLKNSMVFVIGGSNDMTYSNYKGLTNAFPAKSIGLININAHLNVREDKTNKFCSNSVFRMITQEDSFKNSNNSFVYHFAIQGAQNTLNDFTYAENNKGKIIFLDKHIRRFTINRTHPEFSTQAGQYFDSVIKELSSKVDVIMVSFDLDSIDSCFCPGVCTPSVIGGLSDVEAEEIFMIIGRNEKVILVDMAEFNPAVENIRTKKLVVTLFYTFCKAVSER
jgi:formiminoglutamase